MKKTKWFPKNITPIRSGWYEVKGGFCENETGKNEYKGFTFRYFDVHQQKWYWNSPIYGFTVASFGLTDKWRGLTEKAK